MKTIDEMKKECHEKFLLVNIAKQKKIQEFFSNLELYDALYKGQFGPKSKQALLELINNWFKLAFRF